MKQIKYLQHNWRGLVYDCCCKILSVPYLLLYPRFLNWIIWF